MTNQNDEPERASARIRGLRKTVKNGVPLPEVSIFSLMDLSNAPRDPETGEIIIKEGKARQGGAASRMKAKGYEVSQEDLDFFWVMETTMADKEMSMEEYLCRRREVRLDDKTLTERAIEAEKSGYLSDEETDAFFADARKRIEDAKNDDLKEVTLITLADEPYYAPADIDFDAPGEIMSIEEVERRTGRRLRSVPKL